MCVCGVRDCRTVLIDYMNGSHDDATVIVTVTESHRKKWVNSVKTDDDPCPDRANGNENDGDVCEEICCLTSIVTSTSNSNETS